MNSANIRTEAPGGGHLLARSEYVLQASRQRVWDLLASTIIQCMPVEQMEIVDDSTFHALLKVKIGFVEIPFRLKVRAAEIDPIASLGTLVTVGKGRFQSSLKVGYLLAELGEERTAVTCTASEEGSSFLMRLLRAEQRKFAKRMFDAIRDDLERNCS